MAQITLTFDSYEELVSFCRNFYPERVEWKRLQSVQLFRLLRLNRQSPTDMNIEDRIFQG